MHRCSSSGAPCILCAHTASSCICVYRSKDLGGPRCNDPHHDPGDHDTGHLGIHHTSRTVAYNEMLVATLLLQVPSLLLHVMVLALLPAGQRSLWWIDGLVSYSLSRARAKVPIGHSDPLGSGWHPIQRELILRIPAAASYVWCFVLPCYSVHHCAWLRTIMYLESDSWHITSRT